MKTPLWRRLLRIQAHLAHLAERLKSRTIAEDAPGETPAVSTSTSGSSRDATEELQSQGERSTETPDREHRHAGSTCYATTEPQSRRRRPHGGACCEYKHIELASQSG